MSEKKTGIVRFWHKHPVLMNFLAIVVVAVLMVWLVGVVFLNYWTRHGDEIAMPQVKNLKVDDARRILEDAEFDVQARFGIQQRCLARHGVASGAA